jgi:hypothetical protein
MLAECKDQPKISDSTASNERALLLGNRQGFVYPIPVFILGVGRMLW